MVYVNIKNMQKLSQNHEFRPFLGFLLKTGVTNIILENKLDIEFVYLFKTLRHITPLTRKLTFGEMSPLSDGDTAARGRKLNTES